MSSHRSGAQGRYDASGPRDRAPTKVRERDYESHRSADRSSHSAQDRSLSPSARGSRNAADDGNPQQSDRPVRPKKVKQLSWLKKPAAALTSSDTAASITNHDRRNANSVHERANTERKSGTTTATNNTANAQAPAVYVKQVKLKTVSNTPDTTAAPAPAPQPTPTGKMIEVLLNDRLGSKARVKCNSDDTIGILKKLAAAQLGTRPEKLRLQKWHTVYKDHIRLDDYEISDGMSLELHYM